MIQPAAQSLTLRIKGMKEAETPVASHRRWQVGQAEEKKGMFGTNSQLPSSCTWGQEAAKKRWFQLEAGSRNRKIKRAMGKAGSALAGLPVLLVSEPWDATLAAALNGGDMEAHGGAESVPKGSAAAPYLAQG